MGFLEVQNQRGQKFIVLEGPPSFSRKLVLDLGLKLVIDSQYGADAVSHAIVVATHIAVEVCAVDATHCGQLFKPRLI